MPGNPREVAEHSLDIKAGSKPVKERLRRFDEGKRRAIGEEIAKLLAAGFIKEVYHPEWLANPILVRKKSGKWRICVDYIGLNKACPKDLFPLPCIDQVVDLTSGCKTLCFLDAYFHHPILIVLLRHNVIRSEKRGGYVSALYAQVFWGPHRVNC